MGLLFFVVVLAAVAQGVVRVREKAPDFSVPALLPNGQFADVSLASLTAGRKWLVLVFYPADYTFACPTELTAFSDANEAFVQRGTQVAFVSTDSKWTHLAWTKTPRREGGVGPVAFPMIGDVAKDVSLAYDAVISDRSADRGLALRSTFIIDPDHIVRHMSVNDLPVARSVDETLRLVDGFQFAAAHPDSACPANWRKGDKTIKTDPVGSKAYFNEL